MTAFDSLLICVLQVTLVAAFGIGLSLILRHSLKASSGLSLVTTLLSVILLTVCSVSPWPSWLHRSSSESGIATVVSEQMEDRLGRSKETMAERDPLQQSVSSRTPTLSTEASASVISWVEDLSATNVQSTENTTSIRWIFGNATALLLASCFVVGLVRLVGGLVGVHVLVRNSRPLDNQRLREHLDLIQVELGCTQNIELRESTALSLAATVGWWRPVILLSESWRGWNETQLRSILAHEIAHIRRGDFLATLFAQIGLVFHFYHPLVHWLANRLRLEQELAADAMAAQIVGGPRVYLNAIGELALRHSSEPVGWPAHSFLPTRRTFLRRIEMLRDLEFLAGEGSGALRWTAAIGVLAITLVAVGLRPPVSGELSNNANAQVPVPTSLALAGAIASPQVEPLTAKYVPEEAQIVTVARGQVIYSTIEKLSLSKLLGAELLRPLAAIKELVQGTWVVVPVQGELAQMAVYGSFANKEARDRALAESMPSVQALQKATLQNHEYQVTADGRMAFFYPDDLTLIYGNHQVVQKMILTEGKSLSPLTKTENWKKASQSALVWSVSVDLLRDSAKQAKLSPAVSALAPLWESATEYTLQIDVGDRLRAELTTVCKDPASTKKVAETMNSGIALLTGMLNSNKTPNSVLVQSITVLEKLLSTQKVQATANECRVSLEVNVDDLAKIVAEPLTVVTYAQDRTAQTNNIKKILLGLQNYLGAYRKFPPAVIVDAASGVKRSWRVEILPYIDGMGELYNQYQKNEPWDSPANKRVLAQMPSVYRHPSQPEDSTTTAVTAAFGDGLLFNRSNKGTTVADVRDGLKDTVAILEVKTDIPWTKPEDIEIDVNKEKMPAFGGIDSAGYTVGFADGTVRFFSKDLDIGTFKKIFTIADGEVNP